MIDNILFLHKNQIVSQTAHLHLRNNDYFGQNSVVEKVKKNYKIIEERINWIHNVRHVHIFTQRLKAYENKLNLKYLINFL